MSRSIAALLALPVVVALAGCQSYAAGLLVICEAPNACADCEKDEPAVSAAKLASYIEKNLSNDDAKETYAALSKLPPEEKRKLLLAEADKAGIPSCPLAERFKSEAAPRAPANEAGPEAAPDDAGAKATEAAPTP